MILCSISIFYFIIFILLKDKLFTVIYNVILLLIKIISLVRCNDLSYLHIYYVIKYKNLLFILLNVNH